MCIIQHYVVRAFPVEHSRLHIYIYIFIYIYIYICIYIYLYIHINVYSVGLQTVMNADVYSLPMTYIYAS
jgi:hypothetical protein